MKMFVFRMSSLFTGTKTRTRIQTSVSRLLGLCLWLPCSKLSPLTGAQCCSALPCWGVQVWKGSFRVVLLALELAPQLPCLSEWSLQAHWKLDSGQLLESPLSKQIWGWHSRGKEFKKCIYFVIPPSCLFINFLFILEDFIPVYSGITHTHILPFSLQLTDLQYVPFTSLGLFFGGGDVFITC